MATVITGSLLGALPTQASTTLLGDVNNDNIISISDAVALNQFLSGQKTLPSYVVADLNEDYMINCIDSEILLDFVLGIIDELPYYTE